jgi:hypothetical protein
MGLQGSFRGHASQPILLICCRIHRETQAARIGADDLHRRIHTMMTPGETPNQESRQRETDIYT